MKNFFPALVLVLLFSPVFGQSANDLPKLNQLGFYPEAPKIAITPETEATTFHLRDASNGSVVYQGELSSASNYSLTGETVKVADFSDFTIPGSYYLVVDGGHQSYEFEIGNNIFDGLSNALIKALYYNRVSVPLEEEHAGAWARAAGHPDDEVIIHPSAASENRPAGSTISSPGGWYDAGDFNKYVVPISSSLNHMLFAYEQFPEYFNGRELNIPESGNNIPDILDEALFALRWLLTMQDPDDGGVYNKLTHANFQGTIMPHQATASRYVVQKGTAATLDFAAVLAQAARVYEPFLPEFADSALSAAEAAWNWAEANPDVEYDQNSMNAEFDPDISTGGYGDNDFTDERFWAASELYITTGNEDYYDSGGWSGVGLSGWGNVQALGLFSLLHHRENLTAVGLADTNSMKQALVDGFEWYVNSGNSSPYRSPFGIQSWQFGWGSNGGAGNLGMSLLMLYQTTGETKYYESALHTLDYLLGRNGVGYSYVTGFGDKTPKNIHHRQSEADNVHEPVPGWVAGGANAGQEDGCSYSSDLPALSYSDTYCSYASNEITTYWNSPFIYLSAGLEHLTPQFSYNPQKSITFVAPVPAPDSVYEPGTEIALQWTADNLNTVDVSYKIFTENEFTELASDVDASSGTYEGFVIPDLPGDSLIFRIEDSEDPDTYTHSAAIKIKPLKSITIESVVAQIKFTPNSRVFISWSSASVDSIDILYKLEMDEEFTIIATAVPAGKKSFSSFSTPDSPGDSFIIRLQDSEADTVFAESDPILIESNVSNEKDELVPQEFSLLQNYPNPFNPVTVIKYQLPVAGKVKLEIFDMLGQKVAGLVDRNQSAGSHSIRFDASDLSSGIYLYKLTAKGFISTKKMMLIK